MNKLKAIWQILYADKIAVFTWKETAFAPTWLAAPNFHWHISDNWNKVDLEFIIRIVNGVIQTTKN